MSLPSLFDEARFRAHVDEALGIARRALRASVGERLAVAAAVDHRYDDKYALVEAAANVALASQLTALAELGLTDSKLTQVRSWSAARRAVVLSFGVEETCQFVREVKREVESAHKHVSSKKNVVTGRSTTTTHSVVRTEITYEWRYEYRYQLRVVCGGGSSSVTLRERSAHTTLTTSAKRNPRSDKHVAVPIEVDVSHLFEQIVDEQPPVFGFTIDRRDAKCHTPRRNANTSATHRYHIDVFKFCERAANQIHQLASIDTHEHTRDLTSATTSAAVSVALPVLPVFDRSNAAAAVAATAAAPAAAAATMTTTAATTTTTTTTTTTAATTSVVAADGDSGGVGTAIVAAAVRGAGGRSSSGRGSAKGHHKKGAGGGVLPPCALPDADTIGVLLREQRHSLREALQKLGARSHMPRADNVQRLATVSEFQLVTVLRHVQRIASAFHEAVQYAEHMLYKQLQDAIGKLLTSADFDDYMRFHSRRVLAPAYAPRPCAYALRRDGHCTEGVVSIEKLLTNQPVLTLVRERRVQAGATADEGAMTFALGTSTSATFTGKHYIHALLTQRFGSDRAPKLRLHARARHYSSFALLIGTIQSASSFAPTFGVVLRNRDELQLPLWLDMLPPPKEFKAKVKSLSPEQQRFANAYRSMQLSGTLFAVLLVELKPQLETVLGLPVDALAKELELSEQLFELLSAYRVPSDVLAYDAAVDIDVKPTDTAGKIEAVRQHAAAVEAMLERERRRVVKEHEQKEKLTAAEHKFRNLATSGGGSAGEKYYDDENEDGCDYSDDYDDDDDGSESLSSSASGCSDGSDESSSSSSASGCSEMGRSEGSYSYSGSDDDSSGSALDSSTASASSGDEASAASASSSSARNREPSVDDNTAVDYTQLPKQLDSRCDAYDVDVALRPTYVRFMRPARVKRAGDDTHDNETVLKLPFASLREQDERHERDRTLALLDVLTRSGTLPLVHTHFHVFFAATHCFDKALFDTVIQDNVNPIEKLERSLLIAASTVHATASPSALLSAAERRRVATYSAPHMLSAPSSDVAAITAADSTKKKQKKKQKKDS